MICLSRMSLFINLKPSKGSGKRRYFDREGGVGRSGPSTGPLPNPARPGWGKD
jgi:hypothetical protein